MEREKQGTGNEYNGNDNTSKNNTTNHKNDNADYPTRPNRKERRKQMFSE